MVISMKNKWKVNRFDIILSLLFIGGCFRWFFIGIYGGLQAEIIILFIGLCCLLFRMKVKFERLSLMWGLYILNIAINIFYHREFDMVTIYYAILLFEIVLFAIFIKKDVCHYERILKYIILYGLFNALFVIIHYVMGNVFTSMYFNLLNEGARTTAENYIRLGHYFGFFIFPADPAGLIGITIFALLFKYMLSNNRKVIYKSKVFIFAILLFIPLLLTGKKGILFLTITTFIIIMLILYASKKQWCKVLGFLLGIVVVFALLWNYITTHQDNELFKRLNDFIYNLNTGGNFDSNRLEVWGYAITAWRSKPILGIGWRTFSDITELIFGSGHEVNCDYLQILCETGIVGLTLTLIPMIVMLYRTVFVCKKSIKDYSRDTNYKWIILCATFVQIFFVLYAAIEIPFYDYTFFTLYIISGMPINSAYRNYRYQLSIPEKF